MRPSSYIRQLDINIQTQSVNSKKRVERHLDVIRVSRSVDDTCVSDDSISHASSMCVDMLHCALVRDISRAKVCM